TRQIERRILVARNHRIWRLAFSPNGETIAAASDDMLVRLFDAGTGRQIGQPLAGHEDEVIDVAFSPDGRTLASTGWDAVTRVWDAATGRPARDPFFGQGVAFSPDGQILASAGCRQWSGETCVQGAALLWDTSAQLPIHRVINSHRAAVLSLAFSPNGPHLAAGDAAGTIALWEAETGEPVIGPVATGAAEIFGLAFSPNGQTLASANGDTTVRLWDGDTLEPRASPFKGHPYWPLAVAFSPNGKTIASAGCHIVDANGLCTEGEIRLWEAATGRPLGDPAVGHAGWVTGLAFSPDRDVLLSGGDDGTLYLWNPGSMQPDGPILAAHPTAVTGLAFSPNGATFASGSCGKFSDDSTHCVQGQILMWDVESRQPKFELPPEQRGAITGLAFSPDGKLLASGSCAEYATGTGDCVAGTARLWDAETGQPIGGPLAGPAAQVTSVAFSPGSALLAAASDDGAIIVWDVTPETWQTWACRIANRNLSQTEWNQFISPDVPYRLTCPALPPGEGVTTQS
ncbi:MAG: WD40 repeat domain-containing protein, partial [Anaerolineae bacterium]